MRWVTFYVFFLYLTNFAGGQFDTFLQTDFNTLADDETVNKKFEILESKIKMLSEEVMKLTFPILTDFMGSLNISRTCFRDSTKLILGLRKLHTWAIKFLDATTKSADGILDNQMPSLGSYDECVDNIVLYDRPQKLKGHVMFQGKYCIVHVRPFLLKNKKVGLINREEVFPERDDIDNKSIFYEIRKLVPLMYYASVKAGLCLPSGCSTDDANSILRLASDSLGISFKATTCMIKEEPKYTPIVIAVMTVYSFTGLLALLGTLVDLYFYYFKKDNKSSGIQILRAFSFMFNFRKLTSIPSSTSISCLNGIRFLSMSWIILGHTYVYHLILHRAIPRNVEDYSDLAFQPVISGVFAVDTFFFLSGFLTCYATMKLVKTEKKAFNWKFYILHRVWRIIPTYAFVMGYEFLKPLTGSGPLFHEIFLYNQDVCKKNWWINFLFINNFYRNENICIPQSWFIAVDMQLHILALLVLLPLMKWPGIGVFMAGLITIAAMIVTGIMSYMDNVIGLFTFSGSIQDLNTWHHYHNMSLHLHAPPFVIGLLVGYLLASRSDFKISKVVQLLGWWLAAAISLMIIYGVQKWNGNLTPTVVEIITYSVFCRTGWSLAIGWMIFCCSTGRGGVINYILSWNVWVPLSRLSYLAYLVHVTVILAYNGNLRTIPEFRHFLIVWIFLGHLLITYAAAFVGYILVESPFASLETILFFRNRKHAVSLKDPPHLGDLEKNENNEKSHFNNLEKNLALAEKKLSVSVFERNTCLPEDKCTRM